MGIVKKPRIKVRSGEAPQTTTYRYRQLKAKVRERKRDLLVFLMLGVTVTMAFIKVALIRDIPELNTLPQYLINVEQVRCESRQFYSEIGSYTFFDLSIISYGNDFLAVDIPMNLCKRLETRIEKGQDVLITHHQGLIFQVLYNDGPLLKYKQLLPGIEDEFYFRALPWQVYGFSLLLLMLVYGIFIPPFRSD